MGSSMDGDYDEEIMFHDSSVATTVHELAVASEFSDDEKELTHEEGTDGSTSDDCEFEYNDKAGSAFRSGFMSVGSGDATETPATLTPLGLKESGQLRPAASQPRRVAPNTNRLSRKSLGPSTASVGPCSLSATASKLGTSMPIDIPLMSRNPFNGFGERRNEDDDSEPFVPPHLLEQQSIGQRNGQASSMQSPSTSVRREKLLRRNSILRSTGFIEGGEKSSMGEVLDPIKESTLDRTDSNQDRGNTSVLSQMLGHAPSTSSIRNF